MRGEVCASCGKEFGKNHPYEKNLERIYEVYPEYKGKKLCKGCGSQYQACACMQDVGSVSVHVYKDG
jgi:hypothetical protein